jgi:hypothetical protein
MRQTYPWRKFEVAMWRRRRLEERELRSLERRSMQSIFPPLDPSETPPRERDFTRRNVLVGPMAPGLDDPMWKTLISWLWLPALIVFLTVVTWLQLPPVLGWMLVIAFCVAYAAFAWLAYRRR